MFNPVNPFQPITVKAWVLHRKLPVAGTLEDALWFAVAAEDSLRTRGGSTASETACILDLITVHLCVCSDGLSDLCRPTPYLCGQVLVLTEGFQYGVDIGSWEQALHQTWTGTDVLQERLHACTQRGWQSGSGYGCLPPSRKALG